MRIFTHKNVDLDNTSAVALAILYFDKISTDDIRFVNADYDGKDVNPTDLALDIDAGGKGLKGVKVKDIYSNILVQSSFSELLNTLPQSYQDCFESLATFIDYADSKADWRLGWDLERNNKAKSIPTILTMFMAIKQYASSDLEVINFWIPIITGLYERHMAYLGAQKEAERAAWPYKGIAIIKNEKYPQTISILHNKGAKFVIYQKGNNLGVHRTRYSTANLGNGLRPQLPDWFHHSAGFLSCWGSNKAPKDSGPEITAEYLAELVYAAFM